MNKYNERASAKILVGAFSICKSVTITSLIIIIIIIIIIICTKWVCKVSI